MPFQFVIVGFFLSTFRRVINLLLTSLLGTVLQKKYLPLVFFVRTSLYSVLGRYSPSTTLVWPSSWLACLVLVCAANWQREFAPVCRLIICGSPLAWSLFTSHAMFWPLWRGELRSDPNGRLPKSDFFKNHCFIIFYFLKHKNARVVQFASRSVPKDESVCLLSSCFNSFLCSG